MLNVLHFNSCSEHLAQGKWCPLCFDPLPSGFSLTHTGEDVLEVAREIEFDMSALAQRMANSQEFEKSLDILVA